MGREPGKKNIAIQGREIQSRPLTLSNFNFCVKFYIERNHRILWLLLNKRKQRIIFILAASRMMTFTELNNSKQLLASIKSNNPTIFSTVEILNSKMYFSSLITHLCKVWKQAFRVKLLSLITLELKIVRRLFSMEVGSTLTSRLTLKGIWALVLYLIWKQIYISIIKAPI